MIQYLIAENPDDRIMMKAACLLDDGGVICMPTDTNWVFAASPFSKTGVDRLYRIKCVDRHKHFSIICNSISQASRYAVISDFAFKKINRRVPGGYTFIFSPTHEIPKVIKGYRKEKQIGIRIPDSIICKRLVKFHEKPLITTSVTTNMLDLNEFDEIYSYLIEDMFGHQLDMILDPGEFYLNGPSSIIDFSESDIPVIERVGAGDISCF